MKLKRQLTRCCFSILLLLGLLIPLGIQQGSAESRADCPVTAAAPLSQLIEQGTARYERGQFAVALDCWQKAAAAYQQAGDRARVQISQINQAQAFRALGLNLRACQIVLQAFGLPPYDCRQLPPTHQETILQTLSRQPHSVATTTGLRSLAEALQAIGNLDLADSVLRLSWVKVQQISHPQERGAILLSLGNLNHALSQRWQNLFLRTQSLKDAIAALNKAQTANEWYQQALQSAPPLLQTQAQLNQLQLLIGLEQWLQELGQQPELLAQLHSTLKPLATAQKWQLQQLQGQMDGLNPSHSSIKARIHFAYHLSQLKQMADQPNLILFATLPELPTWKTIAQHLAIALRDAKALGDRPLVADALGYLGHIYQHTQQWPEAENLTQQAVTVARSLDIPRMAYQWEAQLGDIWYAQEKVEAAIAAYQAAIESLKTVRGDLLTLDPDIQFSFRENVEPIYRKLMALLLPIAGEPNSQTLLQSLNTLDGLQTAELENFLQCQLLPVVAVATVVEQTDFQAAVIYPIILENRLEIIVKLPDQPLRHQRTLVDQKRLETTLKELRTDLKRRDSGRDFEAASSQVYEWLIRPILPYLKPEHIKTLVFVLDGPFRNVPMAALYRQDVGSDTGRYLVQDYAIAITPGLNLLGPKRFAPRQFTALIAGLTQPRQLTVNHREFRFSELPHVETEVREIVAALPQNADILLDQITGREFTTDRLRRQINAFPYPIVHLATHGQFSSNPEETFIVTAADEPIYLSDFEALFQVRKEGAPDALELIVLSACQTATGDDRAALGMAGVAIRSGASSTLASLWSVDDQSTAQLMTHFYQTLVKQLNQPERITKAEVLRRAQLQLLQSPPNSNYRHPYYWAPFVLVGNWL